MSSTGSSFSQTVDTDLQQLADTLGLDIVTSLKSIANTATNNIIATPSATNAAIQLAALLPAAIGAAPTVESEGITALATFVQKVFNAIPTPTVTAG